MNDMKRKLLVVLAVVAMLTAAVAAPATARGAIHGDIDLTLYLTPCDDTDPDSPLLTWAGTYDLGKMTLGIAYFPTADLEVIGDTGWVYFEERLTLFKLPKGDLSDEKMIAAACNPRRVVVEGMDAGVGTPWGTAFGAGHVTDARWRLDRYVGGETFWWGAYTNDELTQFAGQLWIFPAWPR